MCAAFKLKSFHWPGRRMKRLESIHHLANDIFLWFGGQPPSNWTSRGAQHWEKTAAVGTGLRNFFFSVSHKSLKRKRSRLRFFKKAQVDRAFNYFTFGEQMFPTMLKNGDLHNKVKLASFVFPNQNKLSQVSETDFIDKKSPEPKSHLWV